MPAGNCCITETKPLLGIVAEWPFIIPAIGWKTSALDILASVLITDVLLLFFIIVKSNWEPTSPYTFISLRSPLSETWLEPYTIFFIKLVLVIAFLAEAFMKAAVWLAFIEVAAGCGICTSEIKNKSITYSVILFLLSLVTLFVFKVKLGICGSNNLVKLKAGCDKK